MIPPTAPPDMINPPTPDTEKYFKYRKTNYFTKNCKIKNKKRR